jgi:ribosomal protein S20
VANIKSQIKRIKTNEKARLRNKSVSSSIKTAVRKFRDALTAGDANAIQQNFALHLSLLMLLFKKVFFTRTLLQIKSLQWLRQLPKPAHVNSLLFIKRG